MLSSFTVLITVLVMSACQPAGQSEEGALMSKISQFAETEITYDHSLLNDRQKVVVENLYRAAKIMDELFLDQVYSRNYEIRDELLKDESKSGREKLLYFNIMFGPFDRLDEHKPFIGDKPQPEGANFYPEDMTKAEFEAWLDAHPETRAKYTSEFTVIRRDGDGLKAIPYSEYYSTQLGQAADYLRKAAEYADNPSLKRYLLTRADAFLSNDYFESDMAWMDLKDHTIEVIIGPYEVYEDRLFNYKAAFECFLTLIDPVESEKLKVFASYLNDMEKHLPIPDEHKNFNRGSESPIMVVQEVFSAGDTKAGVQTIAFNLPNDERVREAKGSKKVMLKNINQAKFDKLLRPIAEIVLNPEDVEYVTFDAFFNHTLMHEMTHGIGPGIITKDGKKTEVKIELKETYTKIEECKADVLGIYNNIFMIDKSVYPASFAKEIHITNLPGMIRSIRFGIHEAHGASNAMILNYLLEKGAYAYNQETKKLSVNFDKIDEGIVSLANELLMIQANGDYEAAKAFVAKYAVSTPVIEELQNSLTHLPVDIRPVFQIEKELADAK